MLNKKLRGSSKKYFDSGDYIMERDRSVSKPTKNRPPQLVLKGKAIKDLTLAFRNYLKLLFQLI